MVVAALGGCTEQGPQGVYVGEPSPSAAVAPASRYSVRFQDGTASVDVSILKQSAIFVYRVRVEGDHVLLMADRSGAPHWTFAIRDPQTLECVNCPPGAPRLWRHQRPAG